MVQLDCEQIVLFDDTAIFFAFEHIEELYRMNSRTGKLNNSKYPLLEQFDIYICQYSQSGSIQLWQVVSGPIIINSIKLSKVMNNDLAFDLPLQINNNIFNLQKISSIKSKDMPKQMKNDIYRQPRISKENVVSKDQRPSLKSNQDQLNEKLLAVGDMQKSKHNNRSNHLRALIKKKLLSSEKVLQNGSKLKNPCFINQQARVEAEPKLSRYQMLLSQFYGTPAKDSSKQKHLPQLAKNKNQNLFCMQRHQSVRNINQILKGGNKETTLGRYRSQAFLNKVLLSSQGKKPQKNSNLKTEISKIPTYLDLYKQKKRLMLS